MKTPDKICHDNSAYNGETENHLNLGERLCLKAHFKPNRNPLMATTEFCTKLLNSTFLIHDFQDVRESQVDHNKKKKKKM